MSALLLDASATRTVLDDAAVPALMSALRTALISVADGTASAPSRTAAFSPHGLLGAMPGYVPGLGIGGKLTTVFPLPGGGSAHRGIVLLADPETGRPVALMDAEAVTAVRTAASATLSMLTLARPDPALIAVIGAGAQARAQLGMLAAIGCTAQVHVASRSPERAAEAARLLPGALACSSIQEAVAGADVVFCCTNATEPVIEINWLPPGAHVSSVGGSHGHEVDSSIIRAGHLFAEWHGAAAAAPPAGAYELQGVDSGNLTLLGAVLGGSVPGRRSEDKLTVFKSTGHAALDIAAAAVALERARARGLGVEIDI